MHTEICCCSIVQARVETPKQFLCRMYINCGQLFSEEVAGIQNYYCMQYMRSSISSNQLYVRSTGDLYVRLGASNLPPQMLQ